jgi:hypothetical protein
VTKSRHGYFKSIAPLIEYVGWVTVSVVRFAFLVLSVCMALLINGVKESKSVSNIFDGLKVTLATFMIADGAI